MTTIETKRLSDKLHERATEIAAGAIDKQGITLSIEEACAFVAWMQERSAEARALERMLERRLKTSDIPGRGGAPLPAAPPARAGDISGDHAPNLIQFRPRAGARVLPFEGGAA